MSPSIHSLLLPQYQKHKGHMTAQRKDSISKSLPTSLQLCMALTLSFGHWDVGRNTGEPYREGHIFCSLFSYLAGIWMWWLKSKQPSWSRREKLGVEVARSRRKESRSFMTVLLSNWPQTTCIYVREKCTIFSYKLCYFRFSGSCCCTEPCFIHLVTGLMKNWG